MPLSVEVKRSGGRFNPVFHSSAIHEEMERRKAEVFGAHAQMQVSHTPFRSRDQRRFDGQKMGQELDVSGASALDESFASVSSFGGGVKRPRADNVTLAFPKDMTVCESIYHPAAVDSSALETPPAAKRPRFAAAGEGSAAAAAAPLSEAGVKRLARFRQSRCSILSILETPKINKRERRPSAAAASFAATPSAAAAAAPTGMATPQSILKMKRLMTAQTPPPAASDSVAKVLDLSGADKEEEEEEDHENWLVSAGGGARPSARRLLDEVRAMEERRSRESTPSKSIRFSVPKAYPPSQLSREGPAGGAGALVTEEEEEVSFGNKERMEESAESYRTVGSPATDEKLLVAVEEEEEKEVEEVMEVEDVTGEKEKEEAADVGEEEEVEEVVAAETEETVAEEEEQVEEVAEERSDKAAEEQEETEAEVQVEEEAVKGAEDAAPEQGKAEEEEEAEEEKPAEVQDEPSLPSPPKLPSTPEKKSRRSASPKSSPAASATATSAHSPKSPERRGLSARIRYSKLMFLVLDLQESCMSVFLTGALKFFQGFDGEPSFPEQEQRRGRLPHHHQDGDDDASAGLFLVSHHQQGEDSYGGKVSQGRQGPLASGRAGEEEGSQGFFAVASEEGGGACTQDPGGEGFPSEGDGRRG